MRYSVFFLTIPSSYWCATKNENVTSFVDRTRPLSMSIFIPRETNVFGGILESACLSARPSVCSCIRPCTKCYLFSIANSSVGFDAIQCIESIVIHRSYTEVVQDAAYNHLLSIV